MPQFLQLMAQNVVNINSGNKSSIPLITVNTPFRATETVTSGTFSKAEYLNISKSINVIINCTGRAPSILNTTQGTIKFETMVYTLSKILNYQAVNKALPANVSVKKWAYTSTTTIPVLRPVYIISDIINNKAYDNNRINLIVNATKGLGLKSYNYGVGTSNLGILTNQTVASNALVVEIAGGADAGCIKEMGSQYYKNLKGSKKVFTVFTEGATKITGLAWLPRAHDDNYSPPSFTGIARPDLFLLNNGFHYYEGYINSKVNELAAILYNEACT